jgi:hypothetical protein
VVARTCDPCTQELSQENHKIKDNLSYTERPLLKKPRTGDVAHGETFAWHTQRTGFDL